MKRTKNNILKRITAIILSVLIVIAGIPFVMAEGEDLNRKVDPSTMDTWKNLFGPDTTDTKNAGAVWMDKSVFTDASEFPNSVKMLDDENNFLVALSAIASNKEIVGYSTIPTDTMLVLDVSGSMSSSASTLVAAANSAIKKLLDTNLNNRIGVVVYGGNTLAAASTYEQGTRLLLPLDRYTATNNNYLVLSAGEVSVSSGLRNSDNKRVTGSKNVEGGTYIQAGLYEALKQFKAKYDANDTVVRDNFQDGVKRLPITVLMSDGAPTTSTANFAEVDKTYTVGTGKNRVTTDRSMSGDGSYSTAEIGFLTQLTASYTLSKMEEYYDRTGEGLFYTLGLTSNLSDAQEPFALAVLDPKNKANDQMTAYWKSYLELSSSASLEITAPPTSGSTYIKLSIPKNSHAVNPFYVDEYFEANSTRAMLEAFDNIVNQIIIQSRYYPTSLEGGNPDFSGYITFEDKIGEYMEVKDIKGILAGDVLFSGEMMTSKITSGQDGLGTVEKPTELGIKFIEAIKARLGIKESADVFSLVDKAWNAGQLSYNPQTKEFSNYIGWYAGADGGYLGFYNEGTTTAPKGAVYANKSYGFLGTSGGSIAPSDMMFMSVQVHTNLITKDQTVIWKIPAALVPLVTYKVTLKGDSIENAQDVQISYESNEPIRLLFETGLRSDINPLNVSQIIDKRYIADDGVTRQFYSNYWDNSAPDHPDHITTDVGFVPSVQNERYYYTEDASIYYKDSDGDYVKVTDRNYTFDKTYYHARWIFEENKSTAVAYYEEISSESLAKRKYDDAQKEWYIPLGTVYQYYTSYIVPKAENVTKSIIFSAFPYVTRTNASYEVDAKLGNNGILFVKAATGIKITKTVDTVEPGASDVFKFKVTLTAPAGQNLKSSYPAVIAKLDKTTGETKNLEVKNGVIEVEIKRDESVYITDLPEGTSYVIEEIAVNPAYKLKTIHIDGREAFGRAAGRVIKAHLADVDFVNTPISEGNLVITKEVVHPFGANYQVNNNITFTARVRLTNPVSNMGNKSFTVTTAQGDSTVTTDANGVFTVSLKNGESVAIRAIPERTDYEITEINIPAGFALDRQKSTALEGVIGADKNASALLVNNYTPQSVSPDIEVEITKNLTGRQWIDNDSFEFEVLRHDNISRNTSTLVGGVTVTKNSPKTLSVHLNNEVYEQLGTYVYSIVEKAGGLGGVTYDTAERIFTVTVTDNDMDSKLEISQVSNLLNTTVSGDNQSGFKVSATFNNTYKAQSKSAVLINVQKRMNAQNFQLNGFKFGLYDITGENLIHESSLTDVSGKAFFDIAYSANDVGNTFNYILKEIDTGINGMNYDTKEYPVSVKITDNLDGTTSAELRVDSIPQTETQPVFINNYNPADATVVISGTKNLTGRVLNDGEFEFNLYKLAGQNDTISGKTPIQTVKNDAHGNFAFDHLTLEQAGTFFFAVNETKGTLGGITYDETLHIVKVEVEDTGGVLVAKTEFLQGGIVFNNTYKTDNAEFDFTGVKTLYGRDIRDDEFTFKLVGEEIDKTVTNKGATFDFGTVTYTKAGVYNYTVTEVKGNEKGITYDEGVYTVTVTVTDNSNGKLIITDVKYLKNGTAATSLVFTNSYNAAPTKFVIEGEKVLSGRGLKEGEFEFTLLDSHTQEVFEKVKNGADGKFSFTARPVTTAGTFRVRVVENATELLGIDYDTSVFTAVITVVDNLNGNLEVTDIEYFKNEQKVEKIVFNNTYHASPVEVEFGGVKKLTGRELNADEFTFELYAADGTAPVDSVKNDADGRFVFEKIKFETTGVYEYTVKEKAGDKYGITYDEGVYKITVTVEDNLNGALYATTKTEFNTENTETVLFNNVFDCEDVTVEITVKKTVDNKTVQNIAVSGFEFVLTDKDNKAVKTVTTDEQGIAKITLTFDKEAQGKEFTYKLSETKGDIEGMKYSEKVYEYKIRIDYDKDYKLVATVTKDGKNEDALNAEFVNVYEGVKKEEPPVKTDTGDDFSVNSWVAVLFISGGIIPFAVAKKKKREEN